MSATRIVLFTLLCKLAVSVGEPLHPLSDDFIDLINKEGKWRAGRNFPADMPMEYIRHLMGTHVKFSDFKKWPVVTHDSKLIHDLPGSFDARNKWPNCPTLNEIRDQGECGSCWAFGSIEAMTDRVCIFSNGTKHFHFSAEDVVTCNTESFGCNGGGLTAAWEEWVDVGYVSGGNYNSREGCKPYSIPTCKNHMKSCTHYKTTPLCVNSCEEGYNIPYEKDKKRGKKFYIIFGEEDIMAEIQKNGPVVGSFMVYEDFANYKGGVYQHLTGEPLGLHAIKTLGWGVENGTKYWLIANSWGTDFGDNGFFKIIRGAHNYLDMYAVAGEPLLEDY